MHDHRHALETAILFDFPSQHITIHARHLDIGDHAVHILAYRSAGFFRPAGKGLQMVPGIDAIDLAGITDAKIVQNAPQLSARHDRIIAEKHLGALQGIALDTIDLGVMAQPEHIGKHFLDIQQHQGAVIGHLIDAGQQAGILLIR